MKQTGRTILAAAALAVAAGGFAAPAAAQQKLTIGLPGIPPVFVTTQPYVAQQEGIFKKYGLDVELRPFDSGAAAARAVAAGQIAFSMSPSPLVVTMVSNNPDVDLVMIYGYERPTWKLGSMDPSIKTCEDVKGKPVGVDSLGGARSIALNQMLRSCKLGADDTQQVALSANVGTAMIAGQIPLGVLHIDDLPVIEREAKKPVGIVIDINKVIEVNHYLGLTTTRKMVKEQPETLARVVAAFIEAERFIRDPKNLEAVAKAAAPTGRSANDARTAVQEYVKIQFWPHEHGLSRKNVEAIIATQKRVGNIKGDPAPYDRVADLSIYQAALKLVK
jgi:NitT/TauT family transport system substrate-binding protein